MNPTQPGVVRTGDVVKFLKLVELLANFWVSHKFWKAISAEPKFAPPSTVKVCPVI